MPPEGWQTYSKCTSQTNISNRVRGAFKRSHGRQEENPAYYFFLFVGFVVLNWDFFVVVGFDVGIDVGVEVGVTSTIERSLSSGLAPLVGSREKVTCT